MNAMKLPPYMMDASGYCYAATYELADRQELAPWFGEVGPDGYARPGTEPAPPWQGQTVVCLASGPSLTEEDCRAVQASGLRTVVANDTHRLVPFADVLCAADLGWWQQHNHEVRESVQRWTTSVPAAQEFDLHLFVQRTPASNSGATAVELAAELGATRVLLLGYDCSLEHGTHWHGRHERTANPDEGTVGRWRGHFASLAERLAKRGVEVINCSRYTALTCFARQDLHVALDKLKKMEAANNT